MRPPEGEGPDPPEAARDPPAPVGASEAVPSEQCRLAVQQLASVPAAAGAIAAAAAAASAVAAAVAAADGAAAAAAVGGAR